ncbi:MAG: hypothetical protein ACEY3J_03275 [Arsenophonus sp.]
MKKLKKDREEFFPFYDFKSAQWGAGGQIRTENHILNQLFRQ